MCVKTQFTAQANPEISHDLLARKEGRTHKQDFSGFLAPPRAGNGGEKANEISPSFLPYALMVHVPCRQQFIYPPSPAPTFKVSLEQGSEAGGKREYLYRTVRVLAYIHTPFVKYRYKQVTVE
jgi:hypothetical protein